LDIERIQNFCTPKEIQWKFQPHSATHLEGAWEGLEKYKKKTLKAILEHRTVFKVVLRTALVEAEGILNSRPIIQVSNDAEDTEALTPNRFLLLRANQNYKDAEVSNEDIKPTKMWRQSQALANSFWRHFTKECLPSLTETRKERKEQ